MSRVSKRSKRLSHNINRQRKVVLRRQEEKKQALLFERRIVALELRYKLF